jgi:hypothetical protein
MVILLVSTLLIVRAYDGFGVCPWQLEEARITVTAIFRDVGVGVRWRDCPRSAGGPIADRCDDPAGSDDVVVRLLAAPRGRPTTVFDNVLGDAVVGPKWQTGSFVTVFVNRVLATAGTVSADPGTVLGRVIAHELGHVMLGARHGRTGLMRARWTLDELRRDAGEEWMFTPGEALGMRRRLVASASAP